jgi:hypothetical protein
MLSTSAEVTDTSPLPGVPFHPETWKLFEYGRDGEAILLRQVLAGRLQDEAALCHRVLALEIERHEQRHSIDWQFTFHDARSKLEPFYPVKESSVD